jgi:hypothetical protein
LDIATEEIFDVAEYWRMPPPDVEKMSCRKFADLQERMFIIQERRARLNSDVNHSTPDRPNQRVYTGPKKQNV